ncbi:hypothetical protein [Streptomyces sp. V1I1]|uniref:hypothetical protein n=1 Tax=Streptomyces sp. V1I1 TaxID=3042272 RepID=UPI002785C282|nr:hypothetical protein [Streptomyces sp. V1I1]MDQ0941144.1 hypothetical protein [Streptomyces sp. V1I1]
MMNDSVLAAYFDLETDQGPLHARAVADIGRRYLAGRLLPPYQVVTSGNFRQSLAVAFPRWAHVHDPRGLPEPSRSAAWALLCQELNDWDSLEDSRCLSVAKVLARLGFWHTLAGLAPARNGDPESLVHVRLEILHYTAAQVTRGMAPNLAARTTELLVRVAENHRFPANARLSAAINLLVKHARSDRTMSEMLHWQNAAERLMGDPPEGGFSALMLSACWRGMSFVPFFLSDHSEVRRQLDLSEHYARLESADSVQGAYLHPENLRFVLISQSKAAEAAGDRRTAELYLRKVVRLDPLDTASHVLLADNLVISDRLALARRSYRTAAGLGGPYASYAAAQMARLSNRPATMSQRTAKGDEGAKLLWSRSTSSAL